MEQVVSEINHLICTPAIGVDTVEVLLGKEEHDSIGWQEICLQVDPLKEQINFQGVDVWFRKDGVWEKFLSSPNYSLEDIEPPWEIIRVLCETVLSVCGERFCIPLIRLIQNHKSSQLYLLRNFDYQRRHWRTKTQAIAMRALREDEDNYLRISEMRTGNPEIKSC